MTMTFTQLQLNADISKAIAACGYTTPTPIQQLSIPDILAGKDLVASAQTGTGKTAAFTLPVLHRLTLSPSTGKPRVLILTPTRELAAQVTKAAAQYGKFMRFKITSLVGGMPYRQQLRELSQPLDIVVATPGRLLDHMQNRKVNLSNVEMLVLDEADRMLDMGFIDDVKAIAKAIPATRQTLLFSATVDDKLSSVVRQLLKNPVRIDVSPEKMSPALIKQELYVTDNIQHKNRLLQHFLDNENIFKGIIFSATKINADQLANRLIDQGYAAAALHGDLKQNVRNRTVEELRRGKIQFLVATDIAARGIDISDVTHVINYDLPKFAEDYVHRIGRTGRAGKSGVAISFVSPVDARHLQKIERYTGQKIQIESIVGLEATKRLNSAAPAGAERGRRQGGGKGKGGYAAKIASKKPYRENNYRPENKKPAQDRANTYRTNNETRKNTFEKRGAERPKSYAAQSTAARSAGRRIERSEDTRFEKYGVEKREKSGARRSFSTNGPRGGERYYNPRTSGDRAENPRTGAKRPLGSRSDSGERSFSSRSNSESSFRSDRPSTNKRHSDTRDGGRSERFRSDTAPARGKRFEKHDTRKSDTRTKRFNDAPSKRPKTGSKNKNGSSRREYF